MRDFVVNLCLTICAVLVAAFEGVKWFCAAMGRYLEWGMRRFAILQGDCLTTLKRLPDASIQCCVTSPPYFGLRDYKLAPTAWPETEFVPMPGLPALSIPAMECCLGLEPTPEAFIAHIVLVFREVRRVLRDEGTLWANFGDSYNAAGRSGHGTRVGYKQGTNRASDTGADSCRPSVEGLKPKDLIGIPWRVAFALQADKWFLRQDIIWSKPNPMPESVRDRCTKAHEYVFLLTKNEKYFYDYAAVKEEAVKGAAGSTFNTGKTAEHQLNRSSEKERIEDGKRNRRSVWTITPKPFKGAHFATFPPELVEPCILAGSKEGGAVLDPFNGSGTTGLVALQHGRKYIGCELNPEYIAMATKRLMEVQG